MISAGYIPPDANASSAPGHLHDIVRSHQSMYPEAVHFVAEDFDHTDLSAVIPTFYQHVKCATKGENTLDKYALTSSWTSHPHLGQSDLISLL